MITKPVPRNELNEWVILSIGEIVVSAMADFISARIESAYIQRKEEIYRARKQDVRVWAGFEGCYYEGGD